MGSGQPTVEVLARLSPEQVSEVTRLVDAATEADGVRPLSDAVVVHLRHGGESAARHLLLRTDGGELAGYGHVDPTDLAAGSSAELAVDPALRNRGYGRRLVQAAVDAAPDRELRVWAHGRHPAAAALARSMGFEQVRELWQMRRPLDAELPDVPLPPGVAVRAFVPGKDDEAWLAVNARAFATHPEQGAWTAEDLDQRMQEPWFDPAGFFLAERGEDGSAGLVGFHWTKVHREDDAGGDAARRSRGPVGEVYVLGVDPGEQGSGLGRALAVVGLRHLQDRGLPAAMLYTDADNAAAVRLYGRLGFTHWDSDVMFRRLR